MDPKRFYRKDEGEGKGIKGLPKYFAVRVKDDIVSVHCISHVTTDRNDFTGVDTIRYREL